MPGFFAEFPWLFAQQNGAGGAADGGAGGLAAQLMLFAPIAILLYMIVLRPDLNERRKRREMLAAMKKNDRVLTQGGIYGTVVSISDDANKVVLRIDDDRGVKIECTRESIFRVIDPAAEKEKDKEKDKSKATEAV